MKMQLTPCFARTCMMRSGSKSGTDRVLHPAEPADRPTQSPSPLLRREAVERGGLPGIRVVDRRQFDDQLQAAEPQQPLHRLQRRRGATRLEPGNGRLGRARTVGELLLSKARAPAPLPNQLSTDHSTTISFLLCRWIANRLCPRRSASVACLNGRDRAGALRHVECDVLPPIPGVNRGSVVALNMF